LSNEIEERRDLLFPIPPTLIMQNFNLVYCLSSLPVAFRLCNGWRRDDCGYRS
jgi:hypothetical protein